MHTTGTRAREADRARTRIERAFDPDAVRQIKVAADRDLSVGSPTLTAQAFTAGLVDECHLFLVPIVVGGGTPALLAGVHLTLDLLDERWFGNGMVYLHYRTGTREVDAADRIPGGCGGG